MSARRDYGASRRSKASRYAVFIAVAFGLIHFIVLMFFALGPELAPLMVTFIDLPGVCIVELFGIPEHPGAVIAVIICSILYPAILFFPIRLGILKFMRPEPPNECLNCSYDLTGNVSGVCPECGAAIEDAASAKT